MTQYDRLQTHLREAPRTWIPALLRVLMEAARDKEVFVKGGLRTFVNGVLDKWD